MEHRWGRRTSLWTATRLCSEAEKANGRIRDASVSGAFVETSARVAVNTCVQVEFRGAWISACVVRADEDGLGLEWHEFAPAAIVETLERLDELHRLSADYGRNLPRMTAENRRP